MVDGAKRGEVALGKLGVKGQKLGKTFDSISSKTNVMAAAFAALIVVGVAAFFTKAIAAASGFEVKLAEISTLVDTAVFQMDRLEASLKRQSAQFGSNAIEQGAAAYQIISAGAGTATDAINLLTASNKLAVGGVTDVATAADGLTSLLNAYGLAATEAGNVSDALFVGMKAGKTTIGELSSSLGKVAPLAAQLGVGVDELVASISALTKGGISTREAVTGVRAIMAAVVKPTSEALKAAEDLSLNFSAAGLSAAGGFVPFMQEVVTATGGSSEAMAKLFGGVEALIPALALAGQAGIDMSAIMEDMATKGGATQEAFEKMSNTFSFQSAVLRGNLMNVLLAMGKVLTSILTPAIRFLNENFEALSRFVTVAAAAFATLMIPSLLAMIPAIASVTGGLIAMAAAWLLTPFGMIAALILAASAALAVFGEMNIKVGGYTISIWDAFTTAVSVAWDLLKEGAAIISDLFGTGMAVVGNFFSTITDWLFSWVGDWGMTINDIGQLIKDGINWYIGLYVGLIKAIGAIVTQGIPAAFNLAMGAVRNIVLDSVQWIVNTFANAIGSIGDALGFLPGVADDLGDSIRGALKVDFSDTRADVAALREEFSSAGTAITEAFSSAQIDYIGAAGEVIGGVGDTLQNRFTDKLRDANEELLMTQSVLPEVAALTTEVVVPAVDALATSAGGAAKAMGDLNKEQQEFIDGINEEFAAIQEAQGGAVAATEMWHSEQVAKLQSLGLEFTEYADKVEVIFQERLAEAYKTDLNNATDWRSGVEAAIQGLGESVGTEADLAGGAVESIFNNAASAITDFAKTGTLDFKKFASSVAADILMMTTKMLLLGAIKAAFGLADGGPVQSFADGGSVSGPGGPRADKIPAMLSNGEYVINADATSKFGPLLEAINSGNMDMMGLASGGLSNADSSLPAQPAPSASTVDESSSGGDNKSKGGNITIIPSINGSDIVDQFDSDDGDRVLIDMMERNATTIRGILS
jgi:TP901 family phage tail tape measure protein